MENTLIHGKTGLGKTTGYMFNKVTEMIEHHENLIIVDEKKEYFRTFGKELKEEGYKTLVINLDEAEKSNGFNILELPYSLYQRNKKDLSLRILTLIYKELLFNKNDKEDSFWVNAAANYLVGLTILLFQNGSKKEINLGSVYVLMMEYERKSYDKLKSYLESISVTNSLYAYLSGTILAPVDTRGGIIATAKERMSLYIGSDSILNLLCQNDISLNNLETPYALFIFNNEDYSGIANTILDEIFLHLKNYNLILDNADDLNKLSKLDYCLENNQINQVNTYYISRDKEDLVTKYSKNTLNKFSNIIDMEKGQIITRKIGNYTNLVAGKNEIIIRVKMCILIPKKSN